MESAEILSSSPSTSLSVSMANGTSTSSSVEESISMNITEGFSAESLYEAVTSSVRDIINTIATLPLHHDHITTAHSEFACVGSELSEPDFQLYACSGSKITSWIASVFLISMSIFGIIKCLGTHGILNICDLRRSGISFPKRPEFFVLTCSSLPLVVSVLSRPLFTPLSPMHKYFILGWGMAQTRFFFDLFTRTATIYHLVYWVYRTPIIHLIWHICFICELQCKKVHENAKVLFQRRKSVTKTVKASPKRYSKQQPTGRGRTTEWGYADKRRKSRTGKSFRTTSDSVPSPKSSSTNNSGGLNEKNNIPTPVVNAGGVSLIAPQPLIPGSINQLPPDMVPNLNGIMNPYGQMMVMADGYNMFPGGAVGQQTNPYAMNMGYGMGYGMPMNMNNYINQVNAYNQANFMYPMANGMNSDTGKDSSTNTTVTDKPLLNDTPEKAAQVKQKPKIEIPPPTEQFLYRCKRILPGCIYIASFLITLPSIAAFEPEEVDGMILARCTTMCRSYFYYDLVVLITLPTVSVITAFYYSALSKKQINGEKKMTYRLRCYYVTFILLNIPMFVLMLTSIGFRLSEKPYRNIYGTGILIAMTAYHTNFALKSTVYTTGCNCICCSDSCLIRYPKVGRMIASFTTPVAVKDKEALLEGMVIPVRYEK